MKLLFVEVISTEDQTLPKFGQHAVVVSLLKLAMRMLRGEGREVKSFLLATRVQRHFITAWNRREI